MKNLRVALSVVAIIFAASATFAMRSVMPITGYEFIPATQSTPEQCVERSVDCVVNATNDCTLSGHEVRRPNAQTNCGILLKKN